MKYSRSGRKIFWRRAEMRALVTGGGGFVGRHLIARLAAAGVNVMRVSTKDVPGCHHRLNDITSIAEIAVVLEAFRPQQIYHLAGVARASGPAEFYRVNAGFAACLLGAVAACLKTETVVVLLGSAAEYGHAHSNEMPLAETRTPRPDDHYGLSKLAQTELGLAAARAGLNVVLPRAFNIIGPGMPSHVALGDFAGQIVEIEAGRRSPVLSVGNLASLRDFVDVRDVADMLQVMAGSKACLGQVVNLCTGQPVRMADLVDQLIAASGRAIKVRVDPQRYRSLDVPVSYGSPELLRRLTGRGISFDAAALCPEILASARRAAADSACA